MDTKISISAVGCDRELLLEYLQLASENFKFFDSLFGPENLFLSDTPLHPYSVYLWERSNEISKLTAGAFDPSLGDVISLWGNFSAGDICVPDPEFLDSIALIRKSGETLIQNGHFVLFPWKTPNLGGIAKGFAVQRAAEIADSMGIYGVLVEAGGDISVRGFREDGNLWKIGIQHPREPGEIVAVINLKNKAICTSGDYQRFSFVQGTRYHHVIDPSDLSPSRGAISSTVICERAEDADALSTAFMILNLEESKKAAKFFGAEFLVAFEKDSVIHFYASPGFSDNVSEWKIQYMEIE